MRHTATILLIFYFGSLALFLSVNIPERARIDPRSIKERIGTRIHLPYTRTEAEFVDELACLLAVIGFPTLLASLLLRQTRERNQIALRCQAAESGVLSARRFLGDLSAADWAAAGAPHTANDCGIQALIDDLDRKAAEIRTRVAEAEQADAETAQSRQAKATEIKQLLDELQLRAQALADRQGAEAATIGELATSHRSLQDTLKKAEGTGDPQQALVAIQGDVSGLLPRIIALEDLKPHILATSKRVAELRELLAKADGDTEHTLVGLLVNLRKAADVVVAECKRAEGDGKSEAALQALQRDLDGVTSRVQILEGFAPGIAPMKEAFFDLKQRLRVLNDMDIGDAVTRIGQLRSTVSDWARTLESVNVPAKLEEFKAAKALFDQKLAKILAALAVVSAPAASASPAPPKS